MTWSWCLFYPAARPGSAATTASTATPTTSSLRAGLAALLLLSLVPGSIQQRDPVNNFCRRFSHQTAVVDERLYIDGGLLNWNPITSYPQNYTNTWLSYHDIGTVADSGMPQLYANLSKNASIPNVNGGALWADDVNKRLYLFGGEFYQEPPVAFSLFAYDILHDQWDNLGSPRASSSIGGISYGAGVSVSARGEAFYYGGWMSNATVPGWGTGPPVATANLVRYTMDTNQWVNTSGPDTTRRAEGVLLYIPAGDAGMLVYFGGVQDLYANGTISPQPLNQIFIYDVLSSKWYVQNATGEVPQNRRRFCAGVTWAPDQSSYNIYLYGGLGFPGTPSAVGYDDVYILSIPSFTWIKMYPLDRSGTGDYPHHSLSCNIVNGGAQMLIIGGSFPLSTDCDAPTQWGVHNLDLGKQNPNNSPWELFVPNKTTYAVPEEIYDVIGGTKTGGATRTTPAGGFSNNDLRLLMTRKAQVAVRTPTRNVEPTSEPSGPSLSTGAIVGIAVGGAVVLLAVAVGCFCLIRRRRANKRQARPAGGAVGGYPDSHSGLGPHLGSAAWTPQSSHFTPSSPFPPQSPYHISRPQTVPPHTGPPVELPVGSPGPHPYSPHGTPPPPGSQSGYLHGTAPGATPPLMTDQVKYDAQGNAWVPQISMVQISPVHHRSSSGGSPLQPGAPPLGNYQFAGAYNNQHQHSPVTSSPHSTSALGVSQQQQPVPPQELDPDPRAIHPREGSTGSVGSQPRHNTYYHP